MSQSIQSEQVYTNKISNNHLTEIKQSSREEILQLVKNSQSEGGMLWPLLLQGGASASEIAEEAFADVPNIQHVKLVFEPNLIRIDGEMSSHSTPRQFYEKLSLAARHWSAQGKAVVLSVEGVDQGEFGLINAIRAHVLDEPSVFQAIVFSAPEGSEVPHALYTVCQKFVKK